MTKTIAIIPTHNEERTIKEVVARTRRFVNEVIVVDDSITKKVGIIAKKAGAYVLSNEGNKGVGFSRRRGIQEALERKADLIITLDADLQHKPEDIPRFIIKIIQGYEVVVGERDLREYPIIKKLGNLWLSSLTNFICGTDIRDTECGYKAFSRQAAKRLDLRADRYEIEAEIIYEIGRNNLSHSYLRIDSPVYRKGVTVVQGIKNFIYLLKRRISDL